MLTRFVCITQKKKPNPVGVFFVGLKWCHWPINTSAKAITFIKVAVEDYLFIYFCDEFWLFVIFSREPKLGRICCSRVTSVLFQQKMCEIPREDFFFKNTKLWEC